MADAPAAPVKSQVKETLVSIIIAFALAFVFRAFVIEAFVIPTGSMAPTLLGAHMRFTGPDTGVNWTVNLPESGAAPRPEPFTDPVSHQPVAVVNPSRRSGDRILVFKYLYSIYDPQRWDAVVFKAPTHPQTNYIKRLIGLPGEQLALVDGDVFTRTPPPNEQSVDDPWSLPGWTIARKPERVQRAVWQTLFDTRFAPVSPPSDRRPFPPAASATAWQASGAEWKLDVLDGSCYEAVGGPGAVGLHWDSLRWPINDHYAYNERSPARVFPVSDLRMRCGVRPEGAGLVVTAIVRARGHEFRARVDGAAATLAMRPFADGREEEGGEDGWKELASATLAAPLAPGAVTPFEFWHVDQALELWIDGRRIAHAEYPWTLAQRLRFATGWTPSDVLAEYKADESDVLLNADRYSKPVVRWVFSGAGGSRPAFSLRGVGLDRDLFYQPGVYARASAGGLRLDGPAKATHPANTPLLGPDHFFVCGDNSPQSEDARLWTEPDPWVQHSIDATRGVVPRDLLIGKAFFVYFPSLIKDTKSSIPVPDFGRMRFIW